MQQEKHSKTMVGMAHFYNFCGSTIEFSMLFFLTLALILSQPKRALEKLFHSRSRVGSGLKMSGNVFPMGKLRQILRPGLVWKLLQKWQRQEGAGEWATRRF